MKIKITTIALLVIILSSSLLCQADKRHVLFLGNSYTYFNGGLENTLAGIATSLGDTLLHDNNTPAGYTAQQHATDATTLAKIAQGGWDYVAIQCQSQEPSFSTAQVMAQTYPYVMTLDSMIQASNTCAETLFFMTWGREAGDIQNNPNDTYDAMQQRLRNGYTLFADSTNASLSPVGAAWKIMRDNHPNINLYQADGSHPSASGTYLAACVFYCTLFKKSCVGSQYLLGGVGNGDAFVIQQVASNLVLDSLENWHGMGMIPEADFTPFVSTVPYLYSFANNAKRFVSSRWDFGDGSPVDTTTSPFHTFPNANSTFTVCLEVTSACGKKDSTCQTVMTNSTATADFSATDKIKIYQNQQQISISNNWGPCELVIFDLNGRKLKSLQLKNGSTTLRKNDFASGLYLLQIKKGVQLLKTHKFLSN